MLLDGDGFEHYGVTIGNMANGVMASQSQCSLVNTRSRTGSVSLQIGQGGGLNRGFFRRVIPAGLRTTAGCAFAMWMDALPGLSNIRGISFLDSNASVIARFDIQTDGRISAKNAAGTQLGLSTFPVIVAGAWNWLEFKLGRSSTVGIMHSRVNMVEVDGVMLDNQNTNGGTTDIAQINLGDVPGTTSGSATMWVDDYLVWDTLGSDNNDWLNDQQLIWRPPTADHPTLPQEFIPSTGGNLWSLIDETNPSATDYITALTNDKQAAFDFADLPSDISQVIGIIPYIFAKKLNPGPCTINMGMLSNSVVGEGQFLASGSPDVPITTVDTFWRTILERNPDTALPFTPAEVNAAYLYLDRVL